MFGKKFCAALCTSLAMASINPKANAVSGIAVFNFISGGIQSLVGAAEIIASVLGFTHVISDKIVECDNDGDRQFFSLTPGIGGLVLGIPTLLSGTSDIASGVVAGNNKKNAQEVKALVSDMQVVKEKLGIADNSVVKK